MCPDPQILSIYLDGELPSPWKEKMESHLTACPKCKEKLANYRHLHELFIRGADHTPIAQKRTIVENEGNTPVSSVNNEDEFNNILEKSKEKVWQRLASKKPYNTNGFTLKATHIRGYGIWRRKLSVPIPVAAAALIIILGTIFYFRIFDKTNNTNYAGNQFDFPNLIEEMPNNFIPAAQDMNSVFQYLTDSTGGDIIILQLPESRNFSRSGEPKIIRSAEFSRDENDQNENSKRRRRSR